MTRSAGAREPSTLVWTVSLAATVGGVGPGRGQERDMVVGVRIRDAKADGYSVQKWDRRVRPPDRSEIVSQAEDELVDPGAQRVAGQEGTVGSTLGIGAHHVQSLSVVALGVDAVELDGQSKIGR